ncbi:MAG: FAD-dependent oxidoreductase, partial [Rhodobacteraceae bacterium]|nr:FAD-dependent oxidoreductase [Paracoccaceae bacterium]
MPDAPTKSHDASWDVIVIGAGVVGCAITRRFALSGAKTLLLERGSDILSGASKANSAIMHTGFDAPPDSVELACMKAGYSEYLDIASKMNLPTMKCGALVVAW